jgi:hypothetical protein
MPDPDITTPTAHPGYAAGRNQVTVGGQRRPEQLDQVPRLRQRRQVGPILSAHGVHIGGEEGRSPAGVDRQLHR